MPTHRHRPRRHSISSGDESVHPHPASLDGLARRESTRRRARLPQSISSSNVLECFEQTTEQPSGFNEDAENVAREEPNVEKLRALAKFFRTTKPPTEVTAVRPTSTDACLGLSSSGGYKRWSLQSRTKYKRPRMRPFSQTDNLPESAVLGTTAEGCRYIAISTPIPKNNTVTGPWFRSQYPVFEPEPAVAEPATSRKNWPERTSSKVAPSPPTGASIPPKTPSGQRQPNDGVSEDHISSPAQHYEASYSKTVSTKPTPLDNSLGTVLNTVEEGHESHTEHEEDVAFEEPRIAPQPGRAATFEKHPIAPQPRASGHNTITDLHAPEVANIPAFTLTYSTSAKRSHSNGKERLRSPKSPASPNQRDSPCSPSRNSKQPANILVRPTLAVPKQNLFPESPGFPNMLAAMSFPSPPIGSRPGSPASLPDAQSLSNMTPAMPAIHPRRSSRLACISKMSAASLDEIIMQKQPALRHAKSEGWPHAHARERRSVGSESGPATELTAVDHLLQGKGVLSNVVPNVYATTDREIVTPSAAYGKKGNRESSASELTATPTSYRHSTLTSGSSHRSSATEMTAETSCTVVPMELVDSEMKQARKGVSSVPDQLYQLLIEAKSKSILPDGYSDGADASERAGSPDSMFGQDSKRCSPSATSSTAIESYFQPKKTISERRLARKAKVREYKTRDLDPSIDAVDSPILGYSPNNAFQASRPPFQCPSPLARGSWSSSMTSTGTAVGVGSSADCQSAGITYALSRNVKLTPAEEESFKPGSVIPHVLTISSVQAIEIAPVNPPSPRWHTSGVTMSPVMVVVDVDPQSGSSTLQLSDASRPEPLMGSRMSLRHKPIKIIPQTRHHPVTMSLNPSTGMIERSSSGSVDLKLNRRSLMTMPTPPISPEATQSPRRLSLPPAQSNVQIAIPPAWDPSSPRRQEWRRPAMKDSGNESRLRSATVKERLSREKQQKEKEITDILAKTVGPPQVAYDTEIVQAEEVQSSEGLEHRLRRLEENNEAWLGVMKPLLENMAKTVDDMRADSRGNILRMSEFIVDMEAEARRFSFYNRKMRQDDRGNATNLPSTN
ncbi:hypothetical protein GGR57DRAFT_509324 [Xylariaceae sp. FL1272]|nr:hypothetical protein GGR57DRAFT_509324 [Xylariaceae sp. FL1272]